MAMMTDLELADIGLSRADLPWVFDRHFVIAFGEAQRHAG